MMGADDSLYIILGAHDMARHRMGADDSLENYIILGAHDMAGTYDGSR